MPAKLPNLDKVLDALSKMHGEPAASIPRAPLEWILWENCAYLVDDERRAQVFATLRTRIGLTAEKIDKASREKLYSVTQLGGMHPEARVDRLKDIAAIALAHGGGGLESVLALPAPQARKVLKLFPSIGDPGADKILMFCGALSKLALESNGLRVLVRLGFGDESKSYATTYRSVLSALGRDAEGDPTRLARAHQLLRAHGQLVCTRSAPDCDACPLAKGCRFAAIVG